MTGLLGVIGDPIAHSLSPLIHTHWLAAAGIDATYIAMHVKAGDFSDHIHALERQPVVGVNITLPHKLAALAIADEASPAAQAIGAVNTLTRHEGCWLGDNTDAPGFLAALAMAGAVELAGRRVLVLGAGGSARAVVYALTGAGAVLTILNRTPERAAALSAEITGGRAVHGGLDPSPQQWGAADIVINTTSRGHGGEGFDLPPGRGRLFFDLSYGAPARNQLSSAAAADWQVQDGLAMLVAQAAESFHIWFGVRPDMSSALALCRQKVEATA